MRTFTHFMPGEQQSCIGCHADRNQAAPRSQPRPLAGLRPAEALQQPEWGLRGFSYAHIVQPVLDQHCVRCHNARKPRGAVDLSGDHTDIFSVSYETLARAGTGAEDPNVGGYSPDRFGGSPYTSWIATYNGMESNILDIQPKQWGSPASRLADLVLTGHPNSGGKPRVNLDRDEQRRIYAWIDLNVPYYGASESNHYEVRGCRQLLPPNLEEVLRDVGTRRCSACHEEGRIPRAFYTRITNVEHNDFLLAPLAEEAGGAEACGQAIFESTDDPDYQAILNTFAPLKSLLRDRPRIDML
jgi:mono/diheme cytochrome c family protein